MQVSCISPAASKVGCGATDFACQCKPANNAAINSAALQCVLSGCGPVTGLAVQASASAVCAVSTILFRTLWFELRDLFWQLLFLCNCPTFITLVLLLHTTNDGIIHSVPPQLQQLRLPRLLPLLLQRQL